MRRFCPFFYGILLAGLGLAGCGPRNTFEPPPPPEVDVAHPAREDVTVYRVFPGRLEAVESVTIQARVHGTLEEIRFQDGDIVEPGQVLFVIEQEPYKTDVQRAEAQLAQAKAAMTLAEAARSRKQKAFQNQAVSELDLLSAEADVESAQAAILAAEAALTRAELNLSYTMVKSPILGQVDRHRVSVGNLVGGAAPSLLTTVVSVHPIDCYFSVDERSGILMRRLADERGAALENAFTNLVLELADGSELEARGVIDFKENQIDPATGTLMVRARFPNENGLLTPGMFGRVRVPYRQPGALLIPERAIARDMTGPYVWLVTENNVVARRAVELGPLAGERRIIVSGLEPADTVVVRGIQRVRPGSPVRIKTAPGQGAGAD
jgi:RND family efflux transporter MFP subunit